MSNSVSHRKTLRRFESLIQLSYPALLASISMIIGTCYGVYGFGRNMRSPRRVMAGVVRRGDPGS